MSDQQKQRGWDHRCPYCGEENAVRTSLDDVTNFVCSANDCEFTPDDVREMIDAWEQILAWVESAPLK